MNEDLIFSGLECPRHIHRRRSNFYITSLHVPFNLYPVEIQEYSWPGHDRVEFPARHARVPGMCGSFVDKTFDLFDATVGNIDDRLRACRVFIHTP
ncbi:hypothetical protein D3C86_1929950 [compost metagenome]